MVTCSNRVPSSGICAKPSPDCLALLRQVTESPHSPTKAERHRRFEYPMMDAFERPNIDHANTQASCGGSLGRSQSAHQYRARSSYVFSSRYEEVQRRVHLLKGYDVPACCTPCPRDKTRPSTSDCKSSSGFSDVARRLSAPPVFLTVCV